MTQRKIVVCEIDKPHRTNVRQIKDSVQFYDAPYLIIANPLACLHQNPAKSLGERVTLNLAWRYTDSGIVETGQAKGRVVWRDGSRDPLEFDLAKTRANLSNHGLRVSLRYVF